MNIIEICGRRYRYRDMPHLSELFSERMQALEQKECQHKQGLLSVREEKRAIVRIMGVPMKAVDLSGVAS